MRQVVYTIGLPSSFFLPLVSLLWILRLGQGRRLDRYWRYSQYRRPQTSKPVSYSKSGSYKYEYAKLQDMTR